MNRFRKLFGDVRFAVIGMIHVDALPAKKNRVLAKKNRVLGRSRLQTDSLTGTPKYGGSLQKVVDRACWDAEVYAGTSVNGVLIENMHDIPYLRAKNISPEVVAVMTRTCSEVRKIVPTQIPCGIQILAAANKEALATALASNLQFIRCEGFVFTHIADEGIIDGCAGELLRYRKYIGAEHVQIFTDIKKKHSSHSITADITIEETAHAAEFFLSDALIVTGVATGCPADKNQVKGVGKHTTLPVLIGSGTDIANVSQYIPFAHGAIVGSHFKENGKWINSVSKPRVDDFVLKVKSLTCQ